MGANPHANGGMLLRDLRMPDFRDVRGGRAVAGCAGIGDTRVLGRFLRDVVKLNAERAISVCSVPTRRSPTVSRRVFEATNRQWYAPD